MAVIKGHLYLPVGLERIEPYQDSELISETLEMPLYMLYCHGMKKYVLREAMQNRLPDSIRLQLRTGIMKGLVERSFMRNFDAVHAMIRKGCSEWKPCIDSAWMYRKMQPNAVREHIDFHVIRICITLTAWQRAFASNGRFCKQFAAIDGSG